MLKHELIEENRHLKEQNEKLSAKISEYVDTIDSLTREVNEFKTVINSVFENEFIREKIKDVVREMMNDCNEYSITCRMEDTFDYKLENSNVLYDRHTY